MKANLKHILIKSLQLKVDYIVRVEFRFGVVIQIVDNESAIVKFVDGEELEYYIKDLLPLVVKFIVCTKNFISYAIRQGDFKDIIAFFDTEEKVKHFVEGHTSTIEGNLEPIFIYPKVDDIIYLRNLVVISKYPFMEKDRLERIGIVTLISNNLYTVRFPNITMEIKRSSFDILNTLDNKYVFKLER